MRVLGIETSCDETSSAVVDDRGVVYTNVVSSQIATHHPYGGVVPELAARDHMKNLRWVVEQAVSNTAFDAMAVTNRPGLVGALHVGFQFAKALAWSRSLPFIGVNHLTGHLLSVFLSNADDRKPLNVEFPFIGLLVSGGHTALYKVDSVRQITRLSSTLDDAAGEAFDKVAKRLGLGYPGGPSIDRLAAQGDPHSVVLPKPMHNNRTHSPLTFSFSGLKTAVMRHVESHGMPQNQALADFCASFQHTVCEALVSRALLAMQEYHVKTLVLAGGVAANSGLRAKAKEGCDKSGYALHIPPTDYCTDNAAMIAYAGAQCLLSGEQSEWTSGVLSRSDVM